MNLKEQLFPDSNITGYTDRNNQPILVGQTLLDENGDKWDVVKLNDESVGVSAHGMLYSFIKLQTFFDISQWVEIVVPASTPDTTPVAMAPFNKEQVRGIPAKPVKKTKRNY